MGNVDVNLEVNFWFIFSIFTNIVCVGELVILVFFLLNFLRLTSPFRSPYFVLYWFWLATLLMTNVITGVLQNSVAAADLEVDHHYSLSLYYYSIASMGFFNVALALVQRSLVAWPSWIKQLTHFGSFCAVLATCMIVPALLSFLPHGLFLRCQRIAATKAECTHLELLLFLLPFATCLLGSIVALAITCVCLCERKRLSNASSLETQMVAQTLSSSLIAATASGLAFVSSFVLQRSWTFRGLPFDLNAASSVLFVVCEYPSLLVLLCNVQFRSQFARTLCCCCGCESCKHPPHRSVVHVATGTLVPRGTNQLRIKCP